MKTWCRLCGQPLTKHHIGNCPAQRIERAEQKQLLKGLTLTQPWATLVAIGAKKVETRSWSTGYTGLLAIHAAKGFPRDCQELCGEDPFECYLQTPPEALPRGCVVAVTKILGCWCTESMSVNLSRQELAFGDYNPGRFAWLLADIQQLPQPIPCKGALGLWDVPAEVQEQIHQQLESTQKETVNGR